MITSEVAHRYASALFLLATDADQHAANLSALQSLAQLFNDDKGIQNFINSPLVRAEKKEEILSAALKDKGVDTNVYNLLLLLAKKGRLPVLSEIATAYEAKTDEVGHVKRGVVRAATALNDTQKAQLLKTIETYTHSKVVLNYQEDANLMGGLTAQVGSLTFDDTVSAHLKRLKDDLNRSQA